LEDSHTLLLEGPEFASAVSSKSTYLFYGGLR
jgi:glycerol-3-phosphate dehydrogenase